MYVLFYVSLASLGFYYAQSVCYNNSCFYCHSHTGTKATSYKVPSDLSTSLESCIRQFKVIVITGLTVSLCSEGKKE